MNPVGLVPLALAGLQGTLAVLIIRNALDPDATMRRWSRHPRFEFVGPNRAAVVRNFGIRLWIGGGMLAISAVVMLFLSVLAFTSPTPAERERQQKASEAAYREDMKRHRAELERQNSDPFAQRPINAETRP